MTGRSGFDGFEKAFAAREAQFVHVWVSGDLETPVSTFLKLAGDDPYGFLLESVEGGATLGRYSAIGYAPDVIWTCRGKTSGVTRDGKAVMSGEPVETLRQLIAESRIERVTEGLPPLRPSGLFGFMGYDMVRLVENIPDSHPDTLDMPDSVFTRPTVLAVFDNVRQMICIMVPVRDHAGNTDKAAKDVFADAVARIDSALARLNSPLPSLPSLPRHANTGAGIDPVSNMTKDAFRLMIQKTIEHIRAGDIFQAVLGQRFSMPFGSDSLSLYRSLRRLNPSPFLFLMRMGDGRKGGFALVGSSPEILVRVRGGIVTIRPIAGTRPRGKTPDEDEALEKELLADEKERAEHLMLLDLGRNDVGRVSETGSVRVTAQFCVERYSHVMHIVSNVEGRLKSGMDPLNALFAGFPAGTVSGAPKVRAMEIIDALEPSRRGFYGGCVGYIDGNGEMDTCITLRTALVKDGMLYVQAGGGIVADSDPDLEYEESKNKAKAIIQAAKDCLGLADGSEPR